MKKILIRYMYKDANYYLKRKFEHCCKILNVEPNELKGLKMESKMKIAEYWNK